MIGQRDLGAHEQMQTEFPSLDVRPDDPIDAVAVGQRQRPEPKSVGLFHQFVGMARAFEKREVTLAPEGGVLMNVHNELS